MAGVAVDKGTAFDGQPRRRTLSVPVEDQPNIRMTFAPVGARPTATALAGAEADPTRVMSPDEIMSAVERAFPTLSSVGSVSQETVVGEQAFRYRFYAPEPYLGVVIKGPNLGHVYAIGPFNGQQLTDYGTSAY